MNLAGQPGRVASPQEAGEGGRVVTFGESVSTCFRKYGDFTGRATRSEYWWFVVLDYLAVFAAMLVLSLFAPAKALAVGAVVAGLVLLGVVVPTIAVWVRRLHDTDHSAVWWFIGLIPLLGALVLFIFLVSEGTPGPNRYGPPATSVKPQRLPGYRP
jgi:uncharacterized membrane protein YhaH (DUF805 family)